MNNLFPPELRTASVIRRWSIVRTINEDTVANHSFFVPFYAVQVARLVEWQGPFGDLTFMALMHDVEEVLTSDIISPVKHQIVDEAKLSNYVTSQMKVRLPLVEAQLYEIMDSMWGESIEKIIKVADKVDACIFLITEIRMGNTVLSPLLKDATQNLRQAWDRLSNYLEFSFEKDVSLWDNEIWPGIQSHWKNGSVGVVSETQD